MMRLRSVGRGVIRSLTMAATAALVMSASPSAQAASLIGPGSAAARQAPVALTTQVRFGGGHGGGGFHGGGGGFHGGGGFRGGGFHGGGFHGGGFRGGGYRAFHGGGGFRYARPIIARPYYAPRYSGYRRHFRPRYYGYAPVYYGPRYYQPRRFCRVVLTYYGPRRVCRVRPWFNHHRRIHNWRGYY